MAMAEARLAELRAYVPARPLWLSFELDEEFFARWARVPAPFGSALGEATFWRTYSRSDNHRLRLDPDCADGRCNCEDLAGRELEPAEHHHVMEKWADVCRRVVEGMHTIEMLHCLSNGINWNADKAQRAAQEAFELMFNFKWTPPGRGIQFMGTAFVHRDAEVEVLQNCAFVPTSPSSQRFPGYGELARPYSTLVNWSMLGVGVGFDTGAAGKVFVHEPNPYKHRPYLIPDSREGWAESVHELISAYFDPAQASAGLPAFDYRAIRPKGAPIKRFGGNASGPEALMRVHERIVEVLDRAAGAYITSRTITDLMNIIGVGVMAGSARRSAEIAIGDYGDWEFARLKSPDMLAERPEAWMSNNSLRTPVGSDYSEIARLIWQNGEPGLYWIENVHNYARMNKIIDQSDKDVTGGNPCLEQQLEDWEMCTLTELYASNIAQNERRAVVKHAYRYAKIVTIANQQISFAPTREVMTRNNRIGLSQTGVAEFYDEHGAEALKGALSEMYDYVQRYDALYSQWYRVNRSIRTTSVKPSGTVSQLPTCTPGVHFAVAGPYYWRRVIMPANSLLSGHLIALGYPSEPRVGDPDNVVISFPEKLRKKVRTEAEVPLFEQLELAYILARYWADNMVSFTAKFSQDMHTPEDIERFLEEAQYKLKGVSLLPLDPGIYEQMPYETMAGGEEEYNKAVALITEFHIDGHPTGLHQVDDRWCDKGECETAFSRFTAEG